MDKLAFEVMAKYKAKKRLESGNTVYMYSERQIADRNRRKARRLEKLRKNIKHLRSQVKRDLQSEDPEKFLTALAVGLIDHTYERVGNDESAQEGHVGVTGWQKSHVSFGKGTATFKYVGKSGVKQTKKVTDASLVKALRDVYEGIDGEDDDLFSINAAKVNEYLKAFDITAKDLRGFHANAEMKAQLKKIRSGGKPLPEDAKKREALLKKEFSKALEETAKIVGHEASTLKSQYLVPGLEADFLKDGVINEKMTKSAVAYPTTPWNIDKHWDGSPVASGSLAQDFSEGFFKRHPQLKRPAPPKVVDKASGGAGGHPEARQHGGEIWLFPKFWQLDSKIQDFVFAHEIGHYVLSEYGLSKFMGVAQKLSIDLWDTSKLPFGQHNMDEAFADCFASYHLEKGELKRRYPEWESLVEAVMGKSVTAAMVTLDQPWVEKMRKDFLTLMKNIPRVKNYKDALTLSQAIRLYGERFKELFFDHYLNTSLKYMEKNLSDSDKSYIDKKLRKSGWDFYIEFGLPFERADSYWSEEARFAKFQQEVERWANRVKAKARTFWSDLKDIIEWYEKSRHYKQPEDPQQIQVETPDVEQVSFEGFRMEIRGFDPSMGYMHEALEQIKFALKDYKAKAKQRAPILLQRQLPMVIDFQAGLGEGGRYEGKFIRINAAGAVGEKNPVRLTKTLAHEMGHHIYKNALSDEAQKFWSTLVRGDYGPLDLRELMRKWPENIGWSHEFSDSLRESDPILSLQVSTVWEGYEPSRMSGGLDKREDFQRLLDQGTQSLHVPKTPITGYAGKNSEEAFCETLGMLVAYGPRAVHEKVRSWFDVVLPGQVKLARLADLVVARYLNL